MKNNLGTLKIGQTIMVGKTKKAEFDQAAMEAARESARGFPDEIEAHAKKGGMLFIHSYPDMDAALAGMNVIGRPTCLFVDNEIMIIEAKQMKAKEGDYIFIGIPRLKGLGKGYVEKIVDGKAYVAGMTSHLEK
jgi:hypothetical protein